MCCYGLLFLPPGKVYVHDVSCSYCTPTPKPTALFLPRLLVCKNQQGFPPLLVCRFEDREKKYQKKRTTERKILPLPEFEPGSPG